MAAFDSSGDGVRGETEIFEAVGGGGSKEGLAKSGRRFLGFGAKFLQDLVFSFVV